MRPSSPRALELLVEGALALTEVEANGIRVDVEYMESAARKVTAKVEALTAQLKEDGVWKEWRKAHGDRSNLGSRPQLADVLYNRLGIECKARTPTGKPATDDSALSKVDLPFVKSYFRLAHLSKVRSTYLTGIMREVVDGFVHPSYNLHTVTTFRGSSDSPNFQNIPIRDPRTGSLIRKAFVPRKPGWVLVETDYGAMEFKIAACVWNDPTMLAYASDPAKDVHRDFAALIFDLPPERVTKSLRHLAKNGFVFPVLYGSWWKNCADHIWEEIAGAEVVGGMELGNSDGKFDPAPGTFQHRVWKAERKFMETCPVFARDKDRVYSDYQKNGWFEMVTGFVLPGIWSRNFVLNAKVQGPAFHCLLWSLTRLVRRELKRLKMQAKVCGQIHDCILSDMPEREIPDYLDAVERIMTKEIRKRWDWIRCPLSVEPDVAHTNWHEKKPWTKADGVWKPKEVT